MDMRSEAKQGTSIGLGLIVATVAFCSFGAVAELLISVAPMAELQISPPLAYLGHAYKGTLYATDPAQATTVEVTIPVPNARPFCAGADCDFYYVMNSIYDNSGRYVQIGFAALGGQWRVAWAALPDCGTSGTQGVDWGYDYVLTPGETYRFSMQLASGVVNYSVYPPNSNNPVWSTTFETGAQYFQLSNQFWCGFPALPHPDYTNYEEIYNVSLEAPPYWRFDFLNNKANSITQTLWQDYTNGNLPTTPNEPVPFSVIGSGADAGNNRVWNEWFYLSMDVKSITVSQGTTSAGTWGRLDLNPLNRWSTNCGGTCPVFLSADVPTGWGWSFTPPSSTPSFTYSITLTIPSNVAVGTYAVLVNASHGGLFTRLNIDIIVTPGGGGGGCVAKGTAILTPSGYVKVEKLAPGMEIVGYDVAANAQVVLNLRVLTSTASDDLVKVNGRLLLTRINQPIFAFHNGTAGWVADPGDLSVGDQILSGETGQWVAVNSITLISKTVAVFDVMTSGPNTFVAEGYVLDQKQP